GDQAGYPALTEGCPGVQVRHPQGAFFADLGQEQQHLETPQAQTVSGFEAAVEVGLQPLSRPDQAEERPGLVGSEMRVQTLWNQCRHSRDPSICILTHIPICLRKHSRRRNSWTNRPLRHHPLLPVGGGHPPSWPLPLPSTTKNHPG